MQRILMILSIISMSCFIYWLWFMSAPQDPTSAVIRVAGHSILGSGTPFSKLRQGTGIIIGTHTVLTPAHVIAGDTDPSIQINGRYYRATVILYDPVMDLAELHTNISLQSPLKFSDNVSIGEQGTFIGYPILSPKFTSKATLIGTTINANRKLYIIKVNGRKGDSGGPFLDSQGNVVGIFLLYLPGKNTGFFLTSEEIRKWLKSTSANAVE